MTYENGRDRIEGWRSRDALTAAMLFAVTSAVVLWQNAHVAVFWDISYVLEIAYRMSLGQMPYREFPLVHAPLTFLIQAAIIRLGGRVFFHHVLYASVVSGLATLVAWRIVLRTLVGSVRSRRAWAISVVLAAPLVVLGVYGIFPTPFYDCDCVAAVLLAVWMLQRITERGKAWAFAAGLLSVIPVFFKQNIGLPFVLIVCVGAVVLRFVSGAKVLGWVLSGASAAMVLAVALLHVTVGLRNYLYWTVTFAGQRRLPGFTEMIDVYREPTLLWALPCVLVGTWFLLRRRELWARTTGVLLIVAPLVPVLLALFRTDDADDRASALLALWPLLLVLAAGHAVWRLWRREWGGVLELAMLAAIHGTLLSQQLWGSTYAIWPLFVVLLAELVSSVEVENSNAEVAVFTVAASAVLFLCGGFYMRSANRLSYAQIENRVVAKPKYASLKGMSVRGEFMPNFEHLLDFAGSYIPMQDGVLLLPGEDPFFYATGRVPRFPELLFDHTTDPYSPQELMLQARTREIKWIVLKTKLQLKDDPMPEKAAVLELLQREFIPIQRLDGYEVWRRR